MYLKRKQQLLSCLNLVTRFKMLDTEYICWYD